MADTLVERVTGQTHADQTPVEVQLLVTDRTVMDGDQDPAHLDGYGPVPATAPRAVRPIPPGRPPTGRPVARSARLPPFANMF
jgi:hypothetical protein